MKTGKQLNVYINTKIYNDFRHYCIKKEINQSKAVEEMILAYMDDYKTEYSKRLQVKRNEIGNDIYKLLQKLIRETYRNEV